LKRLPIDTIKIDQAFIRDLIGDPSDAAVVRAVIDMSHHMKLKVVAEGVETEEQANFLRRSKCDVVQGILFGAAVAAPKLLELLDSVGAGPLLKTPADSGLALLLVDDEENNLRALHRVFRREGYRIHTATSAREGFKILANTPIGVIVSDQRMPDMSGTEFLTRVKALYPDTVRIVLSGYTDLATVTGVVNEGAVYKFLTKPWNDEALRHDIRQAFRLYSEHAAVA
jgi:CheY-like chemotaxis protein